MYLLTTVQNANPYSSISVLDLFPDSLELARHLQHVLDWLSDAGHPTSISLHIDRYRYLSHILDLI